MLQHLIVHFLFHNLSSYGRLKAKEHFKLSTPKWVAVTYERCSLTRDFNYSDLTWKLLVFWKTGRLREVVAYERWSKPEVQLYLPRILAGSLDCSWKPFNTELTDIVYFCFKFSLIITVQKPSNPPLSPA